MWGLLVLTSIVNKSRNSILYVFSLIFELVILLSLVSDLEGKASVNYVLFCVLLCVVFLFYLQSGRCTEKGLRASGFELTKALERLDLPEWRLNIYLTYSLLLLLVLIISSISDKLQFDSGIELIFSCVIGFYVHAVLTNWRAMYYLKKTRASES